jgi:glycosyltransferase involved in cell wall biosynthesis
MLTRPLDDPFSDADVLQPRFRSGDALSASMSSRLRDVRVLFVLPSLGLGGAERQAFLLARHLLQEEGAAVRLISFTRFDTLAAQCEGIGLPYEFFDFTHQYRSRTGHITDALRFITLVRRRRAQILMPYCMFQNVLCGVTWRAAGARVCIWNQRDEGRSRMGRWLEAIALHQTPRYISNSTHGAEFLTDTLHVRNERVSVVHNGVDLSSSAGPPREWRAELGIPANAFVACMVANLHFKKDHATLLTAWRTVVDRLEPSGTPAHLLLAGAPGDAQAAIVQQIADLSLGSRVHLLGEVRDVAGMFRQVDVSVFSSFAEGIPNAVLESMSAGLAVVATDYPGIREAVGTSGVPWLVRPRDPQHLAERMLIAVASPEQRAELGRAGQARVRTEFSVAAMTAGMTRIVLEQWQRRQ